MSNRITYDPLLVRHLALELDRVIGGRACAAAPIFSGTEAELRIEGGRILRFDLHPSRGWVRLLPTGSAGPLLDARCDGVEALLDERMMVIGITPSDRFGAARRELVIELLTNQWNAVLVDGADRRILAVMRERVAGGRVLRTGETYRPPPHAPRFGAAEFDDASGWRRWEETVCAASPDQRRRAVLRSFAWTGSANVDAIVGPADGHSGGALDPCRAAYTRWARIARSTDAAPCILRTSTGRLPYPFPLPGAAAIPAESLLGAMSEIAQAATDAAADAPSPDTADPGLLARIQKRRDSVERRISRLESELQRATQAADIRALGDLLLARLHEVPRGAQEVQLTGWEGESVRLALDPTLGPSENAARLYEEARKRDRAAARIPELISQAESEIARWDEAAAEAREGRVAPWVRAALTTPEDRGSPIAAGYDGKPYREYRTSGGLEVRVGRSAKANDRLTFSHSRPDDVWLHARSVPGSHVILRWSSADAPPARDLEEAAVLAARYSRARTSSMVAVDWTRRKHVRKPRGAPPGSVVIQRAKTLFVAPDEEVEARMRDD